MHSNPLSIPVSRPRRVTARRAVGILLLASLVAFLASPAAAGEVDRRPGWSFAAGLFNIDDSKSEAFEVGVEYRFRPPRFFGRFGLKPVIGLTANEDEAFWAHGGVRLDYAFTEHWVVSPMVGAVLYEQGDSKDLGGSLQFRSGLELSYRFATGQRLGAAFYHLSNAGLESPNPGSNSLVLVWSF